MLEMKNTVIEIQNGFDGLDSSLHVSEERISELKYILIETSKTGNQTEQKIKKANKQTKPQQTQYAETVKHL